VPRIPAGNRATLGFGRGIGHLIFLDEIRWNSRIGCNRRAARQQITATRPRPLTVPIAIPAAMTSCEQMRNIRLDFKSGTANLTVNNPKAVS
jgi:hypothetical protein